MGATIAERQAKWKAKRLALARIAECLQQHDAALFARLQKKAEKITMAAKKQGRQKGDRHAA